MWRQEQFQRDSGPISTCQYLVSSNLGFSNPATAAALKHFVAGGSCLQDSSWQQAVNLVQSPLSEGSSNCTPPQCPPSPSFRDNCSHLAFLTASKHLIRQGSMAENNSDGMISSTSGDWWIRDQQQQQEQQQQQRQHQQQLSNWSSFQLNSCQSGVTSSAASEIEGTEWSPAQLACLGTPSDNDHLSKLAVAMDNTDFSSTSTLVDAEVSMSSFVGMSSNPMWGSILLCDGGNETEPSIESTSMEGLQEALYSKSLLRTRSDSMAHDNNNQAWDFPIKGMGFDTNDMNLSKFSPQLQQSFAQDDRFYSNRLMDMDTSWAIQEPQRQQQQQVGFGMDPFCDQIQGLNQPQFDNSGKVKQEADIYSNTNSSISNISSMGGLQSLDSFRSPTSITDLLNPVNKPFSESFAGGLNTLPQIPLSNDVPSRWMTHSSRLPAMLSQVLPSNSAKHSGLYGHSMSMMRPFSIDFSAPKTDHHRMHSQSAASAAATSTLAYDAKDHPHMALSGTKHLGEESRDQLTDTKRNISNDHGSSSEPFLKRSRIEQSPTLPFKVRKEKLGERITALQQLVAPFGKTDTASVLLEAIGYIKFLHEQVQALSNPYMKNNSNTVSSNRAANDVGKASWSGGGDKSKDSDEPRQDLRSRGLCLVPLHCTQQVATNDNGADYWTPAIGGCSR